MMASKSQLKDQGQTAAQQKQQPASRDIALSISLASTPLPRAVLLDAQLISLVAPNSAPANRQGSKTAAKKVRASHWARHHCTGARAGVNAR